MSAPPQRAFLSGRRIAWLAFAGVTLIAIVVLALRFVPVLGPTGTAWGYCDDLTHARYIDLYTSHFSTTLRAQISAAHFAAAEQLADHQAGIVATCDASPLNVVLAGNGAQVKVTEQRVHYDAVVTTLQLGGADWRITAFPDPAVAPFGIAQSFCDALATADYATAYGFFAPSITAQLTQARYVGVEGFADQTDGKVTACAITQLTLDLPNHTAATRAQVTRQNGPAGGADVAITLAQGATGAWQITTLPTA
ncbi:MAG: hypothetical protein H0X24_15865 [Ktedonobacterales bacterium]|nr:hypothetical protein [Ktedonobacterales bacterium]